MKKKDAERNFVLPLSFMSNIFTAVERTIVRLAAVACST